MGVGQSYVIQQGFIASGAAYALTNGYITGTIAEISAEATVQPAVTVGNITPKVIVMEDVLATRFTQTPSLVGKIIINCALFGIVRVQVGAAVALGDMLTQDATARAITAVRSIAGAQPKQVIGIALQAATAAGQTVDVLLTPGETW